MCEYTKIISYRIFSSFWVTVGHVGFITDNIAVGAAIGYVSTRELNGHTSDDDPMYDSDGYFYIAPMASYYLKLADKLYYTPKVAIGLGFGSVASEYENSSNKIESEKLSKNLFTIGVNLVQFEYKATDHIALGAGLGMGDISYRLTTTSKDDNSIKKSYFDMDLQDSFSISGINLSVKYYF